MKRTISLLICLCMIASAFSFISSAAPATEGKCGDNVFWSFDAETGELVIEGEGAMYDYEPRLVPWMDLEVKGVDICDGITHIGRAAFAGFNQLTEITMSDSVLSIGKYAISDCPMLTDLKISESLISVATFGIAWCEKLTSVRIPATLESIGYKAFCGLSGLSSLTADSENRRYVSINNCLIDKKLGELVAACSISVIPNDGSVVTIASGAFALQQIESVFIPSSVQEIREDAFFSCGTLTDVYYGGGQKEWSSLRSNSATGDDYGNTDLFNACIHYGSVPAGENCSHEWTKLSKKDATYTRSGEITYICNKCHETKTENIPTLISDIAGDADGDGIVSMKDLLHIRKILAGADGIDEAYFANADLNGDGALNMKDVLFMRRTLSAAN